jgi:cysteine desulfuration protein SufE
MIGVYQSSLLLTSMPTAPEKLDLIVEEFAELEPRERLELLLDFAENLPPLPPEYEQQRLQGEHRVNECQTPVFIWTDVVDGQVRIHAWVAPEAPTVKGFVGVLKEAFHGAAADEVLAVEHDLLRRLGLIEALGMQRMRGLHAILSYIRGQVRRASG